MTVPDAAERRRALDVSESYIVQAPAGSGKTELLIQRYLALLAVVDQPEQVVAITFTIKAAGEMRRRVMDALVKSAGPCPDTPHEADTWQLAKAVSSRSHELDWNLAQNPGRLRVRTIDALCASLVRQMPWLSRMGAPLEPIEDADELFHEAARRTLQLLEAGKWSGDVAVLLIHLDNNFKLVQDMLAGMLARRDQWLRHITPGMDANERRGQIEEALAHSVGDAVEELRSFLTPDLAGEWVSMANYAARCLQANGRSGELLECEGLKELPGATERGLWRGLAELVLTQNDEWRKKLTVACGFPPQNKPMKRRCEEFIDQMQSVDGLLEALVELRKSPEPRFSEEQWQVLKAIFTLLPIAEAQLRILFRESGKIDFAGIAMAASRALGGVADPSDLARHVDYTIQHLLVDEFQDTSVSQFELLERLIAGWTPGDGRTLFLVGDPMQSIYLFREAEVGLFPKAEKDGVGLVRPKKLTLTANFRSSAGVVNWVNCTMPEVFPPIADRMTGGIPYSPAIAMKPAESFPPVEVHPFLSEGDEAEAERVVELVRRAREEDPNAKIGILVRARTHLEKILPALRAAEMKFQAVEVQSLDRVPAVEDLVALTRALGHPADRPAWLAVLRAPWCGLTLDDLHRLAGDNRYAAVPDLLRNDDLLRSLSSDGILRATRVRDVMLPALQDRSRSRRALIEGVWLALGGPASLENAGALEDTAAFFDLLGTLEVAGEVNVERLAFGLNRLYARPDSSAGDGLQVMTIHKAKGLEFDVVILPGLGRIARLDDSPLLLWTERPRLGGASDLLIAPVAAEAQQDDAVYDYLKRIRSRRQDHEVGRLLYVAATRAKRRLHLLGQAELREDNGLLSPKPAQRSLLGRLWPAVFETFQAAVGEVRPQPGGVMAAPAEPPPIRRFVRGWTLPAPPAAAIPVIERPHISEQQEVSFRWVGDTLRHVGTVVHAMLRQIAETKADSWTKERVTARRPVVEAALAGLGVPPAEISDATARVLDAVSRTLQEERGFWILRQNGQAACEWEVAGIVDGETIAARVDRTFVDADGARWIIDYKISWHEGGGLAAFLENEEERYRDQLERYRRLFSTLEDRRVRVALYFPLLRAWRELSAPAPAKATQLALFDLQEG